MPNKTRNPNVDHNTAPVDAKLNAAAQNAIHHYLPPSDNDALAEQPSSNLFLVNPNIDPETLLANAAENLVSANEMAATLAFNLDDSQRSIALGIQQLIELSSLLIDRAQEQVAPASGNA
ncbi:hypothetical protein BFW88_07725 [Pseudomonas fluorescens]|uniref:DUF3077 domain-containing protein n=1 Tax=Pseudomonas lactucae TaxID=2813360 RepID=A0A9X1C2E8_9PSED|nr:DUF6124 family protein [Pseudomonas lactucae]OPA95623.1 hypothetical protein BFW88_07725 [Pseudomonas fluorescens]MBN2974931.1 hypothetical protein [Pseudomonas lactucae]MBN2988532.1 hypothetical protein [Pseudomonas lactucae]OPB12947.1 hypothetical protein BFW92_07700 [Pseudomonas fluorescens]OPB25346.1 hypothetical protein BFW93_07720 [Pseudomonas fluorescens]